ncbi:hypothetical protein ALC60_14654 [Trachymyrmex zeteki]|uniref:Uncharacterized protein n=1 Tax=Mycetomoellerius zeteki TaxID=64791 RepID=A0A151WEL5_9HYME|nr:hypothetical protein ALC60_14654 [Trachymyrmex zeteki]
MQRRRNKVKDKPPPDPRREYLDAESSDEAERLAGHLQRLIGHSQVPRCCRFLICLQDYGNLPFDLNRTRRVLEDEPNSSSHEFSWYLHDSKIVKSKDMGGGDGLAMELRRGEGLRNDRDE